MTYNLGRREYLLATDRENRYEFSAMLFKTNILLANSVNEENRHMKSTRINKILNGREKK